MLKSINAQIEAYNADKPEADQIAPLDESSDAWSQLNKLAFWMATDSGKTLVMHANKVRLWEEIAVALLKKYTER